MRYPDLPLLGLLFALLMGCSEDTSAAGCDPENVVDDADLPIGRDGVGRTATGEQSRALARDFVEAVLIDNDPQAASRFLSPGAVQPAPSSGLLYSVLSQIRSEGDWVVAESQVSLAGVAHVATDRFHVQGGRILEHRRDLIAQHPNHRHVLQTALAAAASGVSAR